jgi:hypothetical protein
VSFGEERLGLVRGGRSLRRGRVLGTLHTKSGSAFGGSTLKEGNRDASSLMGRGDTAFKRGGIVMI